MNNEINRSVCPTGSGTTGSLRFFLFVKQRVKGEEAVSNAGECAQLSENSLAADWNTSEEDRAWRNFQYYDSNCLSRFVM